MKLLNPKSTILAAILLVLAACTPSASVRTVIVQPGSAEVNVGELVQLTATVIGSSGISKAVTWSSDDESIASVVSAQDTSATIIGNKAGEVTITATSKQDPTKKATATLKVAAVVNSVSIDTPNNPVYLSLVGTKTVALTATVNGTPGISQAVTWASDNTSIATVDANGLVTAQKEGSTNISATSVADPSKSTQVVVQVVSQLTFGAYPPIVATINQPAPAQAAPNIGGGDADYTFSLDATNPALPAGLTLNPTTGVISGIPTTAAALKSYKINVSDGLGSQASATISITVNAAPSVSYLASNTLTVGTAATITPTTGGGTGTKTYTLTPVAPATGLPAGLIFSTTTGVISGNPTAVTGVTAPSFTVSVKDANNVSTNSSAFSITVGSSMTVTYTQTRALTAGRPITEGVGGNYTKAIVGATGATTFALTGTLPTGLSFDNATGVISGTVDAGLTGLPKNFPLTIQVTDAGSGAVKSTTGFSLTVNPVPTIAATAYNSGSLALTAGTAFTSTTPTVTGGVAPYTFSLDAASPTLPTGVTIAAGGAITGDATTAATASNTYIVKVTDANGATATKNVILVINAAPSVTTGYTSPVTATVGTPFNSSSPVVAGGTGTITFSLAPATTLPGGLTVSPTTGVISGTPTTATPAATYTIRATDTNGAFVALTINLTVSPAPPP